MTESQKKYEKRRMKDCKTYSVKYTPKENIEGDRLKAYLAQTGQSANSYIKGLIKADLDSRGFVIEGGKEYSS